MGYIFRGSYYYAKLQTQATEICPMKIIIALQVLKSRKFCPILLQHYTGPKKGLRNVLVIFQLTIALSEWRKDFDCSDSQLRDIADRIEFFNIVKASRLSVHRLARSIDPATLFQYKYECAYWNSRVLKNCTLEDEDTGSGSSGSSNNELISQIAMVQRWLSERRQYRYRCRGESALCEVPSHELFN